MSRRLLLAVTSAVALYASSAAAVTFEGTYTVAPYHNTTSNGVDLGISGIAPLSFSTSPTVIPALFTISIQEEIDVSSDTTANPIGVNFSFTAPGTEIGTVSGTTQGVLSVNPPGPNNTVPASLQLTWGNSPIVINFDGGIALTIALSDLTITCPADNKKCEPENVYTGKKDKHGKKIYETVYVTGDVLATFTFTVPPDGGPEPGPVPLPAALPLFLSGLGGLGLLGWRRKRKGTPEA